ncbi:hypothetical protein EDEG_04051 [Edhazardia aedis USNM 41457]|uniref:Uncharacterized protein n=1 Tax=Edhazardia aedis (strain USNM 41457) TaxID=1003232 RepID=J8ZNG2_EDHAE|nr:hypothetical protein EDEG_04051 [Edhazardia aedis USNM 41457]|eukprot:EJW01218.1 hypothetical protein EDEG_04051 [Edhazardia aedis USNM 41457]
MLHFIKVVVPFKYKMRFSKFLMYSLVVKCTEIDQNPELSTGSEVNLQESSSRNKRKRILPKKVPSSLSKAYTRENRLNEQNNLLESQTSLESNDYKDTTPFQQKINENQNTSEVIKLQFKLANLTAEFKELQNKYNELFIMYNVLLGDMLHLEQNKTNSQSQKVNGASNLNDIQISDEKVGKEETQIDLSQMISYEKYENDIFYNIDALMGLLFFIGNSAYGRYSQNTQQILNEHKFQDTQSEVLAMNQKIKRMIDDQFVRLSCNSKISEFFINIINVFSNIHMDEENIIYYDSEILNGKIQNIELAKILVAKNNYSSITLHILQNIYSMKKNNEINCLFFKCHIFYALIEKIQEIIGKCENDKLKSYKLKTYQDILALLCAYLFNVTPHENSQYYQMINLKLLILEKFEITDLPALFVFEEYLNSVLSHLTQKSSMDHPEFIRFNENFNKITKIKSKHDCLEFLLSLNLSTINNKRH